MTKKIKVPRCKVSITGKHLFEPQLAFTRTSAQGEQYVVRYFTTTEPLKQCVWCGMVDDRVPVDPRIINKPKK